MGTIEESVQTVAQAWRRSKYYDGAEKWTHIFWEEKFAFRRLFERLDLCATVELACGHGRHAAQILTRVRKLYLVDVLEENIAFCRERLGDDPRLHYIVGDGYTFEPIASDSITAIFCYDAMVHFSPDLVESYLKDAGRVLRKGGMALFHHSNYPAPTDRHYGQNPHARNHMTFDLFQAFVTEADLTIDVSETVNWAGVKGLDRITLVRR